MTVTAEIPSHGGARDACGASTCVARRSLHSSHTAPTRANHEPGIDLDAEGAPSFRWNFSDRQRPSKHQRRKQDAAYCLDNDGMPRPCVPLCNSNALRHAGCEMMSVLLVAPMTVCCGARRVPNSSSAVRECRGIDPRSYVRVSHAQRRIPRYPYSYIPNHATQCLTCRAC